MSAVIGEFMGEYEQAAPTMLRAVFQFPSPEPGAGLGGYVAPPLLNKYPEQNLEWIRGMLRDAGDELFGHNEVGPGEEQPVQWSFTRNSIAMEGLGKEGKELVDTYWKAVHRRLIKHTGTLLSVQLQNRPMAAELLEDAAVRRYHVARFIVGASLKVKRANELINDPEKMKERLKETVYRSLQRRARICGLALPPFPVTGLAWNDCTFVRAVHQNRHWALMAQHVRFTTTLALRGEWRVGGLTSKGYGVLHAVPFESR